MYVVTINGEIFTTTADRRTAIIDPVVVLEENKAGTFRFTVPPTHPKAADLGGERSGIVRVFRNDKMIFDGFIDRITEDIFGQKVVECEGVLSWLNDSIQPQARYTGQTVRQLLTAYINKHNSAVGAGRSFAVGAVTVEDPNNYISCYTNNQSTMQEIKEDLVDDLGGIIRVRDDNGTRKIDYLAEAPRTAAQVIHLGENLLDLVVKNDSAGTVTAVIPLGTRLETETVPGLEKRVDITSVTTGGVPYVFDADAVNAFGWIYKVVTWDDITTPAILKTRAEQYLAQYKFINTTIEAGAVDLSLTSDEFEAFELSDLVRVVSEAHGIDRYFRLTKQEIHLNAPETDKITLGDTLATSLTAQTAASTHAVETAPDDILAQAKENVTEIIKTATGGIVTINYNADNKAEELLIMDTASPETATKVWRFNINGLGYSSNGYGGPYDLAMTMDGAIVADMIKTGTLNAERVGAGTISAAATAVSVPVSWASGSSSSATRDINGFGYTVYTTTIAQAATYATAYRKIDIGSGEITFKTYATATATTPLTAIKFNGRAITADGVEVVTLTSSVVTIGAGLNVAGDVMVSGTVTINGNIAGVGTVHCMNLEAWGYARINGALAAAGNIRTNASKNYGFIKFDQGEQTEYKALIDGTQYGSYSGGTAPAYHSLHLGESYQCITSDVYHYFSQNIYMETGAGLYYRDKDGVFRGLVAAATENNNNIIRIGAGASANEIYLGTVENTEELALRAQALRYSISNGGHTYNLRPYYQAGDTINLVLYTAGYVSSGGQNVYFVIPLDRPVLADYVSIESVDGLILRQNGLYTHGSDASVGVSPASYNASITPAGINVNAHFNHSTNAENNSAIGVYASITITFYNGGVA